MTKFIFKNQSGHPFVFTGTGTIGMEAPLVSMLERGDRVIVLETGYFGHRFTLIAEAIGCQTEVLKPETGLHADPSDLEDLLSKGDYKAVLATHVDTSTSIVNPIEDIVSVSKKHNSYTIIDSVAGLGGLKLDFDNLGADVVLTGSQKALAAPPGACLLAISNRALECMTNRKTPIPSYYLNLINWKTVMDNPTIYLATPAVQVMLALKEALLIIKEEGLENRWLRHSLIAQAFRASIESMNLDFVAEEGYRADTLTAFHVPENKANEIQSFMKARGMVLAGGLQELKGKALRVGHFGNIGTRDIQAVISTLELGLKKIGHDVQIGKAIDAASPYLEKLTE